MLIVHRLSAGGHRYYLNSVGAIASDAPAVGEAPGVWWGTGAATLGLAGNVTGEDLRDVLPAGPGRVPGYDLTFAAPKSVSVLHGLGSAEVAAAVRSAHDAAVRAGLEYIERYACVVRASGVRQVAPGFVVASFRHRVSRADDPHLHTHAVVANVAQARDGRWLAVHSPLLYGERRAGAAVYHAVLRHELSRTVGVTWDQPVAGRADATEVPVEVRAAFSQRQADVRALAGDEVTQLRWAARVSRPEREGLVDAHALAGQWCERAAALGWDAPGLRPRVPDVPAVHDVVPRSDRWNRADLMVAISDQWPDGAPAGRMEAECDHVLRDRSVIGIEAPASGRQATAQFTTVAAVERRSQVAAALADALVVDGRFEELDLRRRQLGEQDRKLLIVTSNPAAASVAASRTAAQATEISAAPSTVASLDAGDCVVLVAPARLDSVAVAAVLEEAGRRAVDVCVATPPGRCTLALEPGAVATVGDPHGDVTAAGSAGAAASAGVMDWAAVRLEGRDAVLVAPASEVEAVNVAARAALRQRGLLGPEVGGYAVGDVVRFGADRPSLGVHRHESAQVVAVSPGAVRLRLADGADVELRVTQMASVVHAHAVPPVPAMVAGRGEMFVVGGFVPRHVDATVHRYVTVAVEARGPQPEWFRTATTDELEGALSRRREDSRLPPELTGLAGERRRLEDRLVAARQWVAEAESRQAQAPDPSARRAWSAQLAAGRAEVTALTAAEPGLARRERVLESRLLETAPARAEIDGLAAQMRLREAAVTVAMEFVPERGYRRSPRPIERDVARSL